MGEGGRTGAGDDDDPDPLLRRHVDEGGLDIVAEAGAYRGGEVDEVVHGEGRGGVGVSVVLVGGMGDETGGVEVLGRIRERS